MTWLLFVSLFLRLCFCCCCFVFCFFCGGGYGDVGWVVQKPQMILWFVCFRCIGVLLHGLPLGPLPIFSAKERVRTFTPPPPLRGCWVLSRARHLGFSHPLRLFAAASTKLKVRLFAGDLKTGSPVRRVSFEDVYRGSRVATQPPAPGVEADAAAGGVWGGAEEVPAEVAVVVKTVLGSHFGW